MNEQNSGSEGSSPIPGVADTRPSALPSYLPWALAVLGVALASFIAIWLMSPDNQAQPESVVDSPPEPVAEPAPEAASPPEMSRALLRAREVAQSWNEGAALASADLTIEAGELSGALEFEFGLTRGAPLVGSTLGERRLVVVIDPSAGLTRKETASKVARSALPDPNCPLPAAYRTVQQAELGDRQSLLVSYRHSQRHGRPIWLFTIPGEKPYNVDANSCAILRR